MKMFRATLLFISAVLTMAAGECIQVTGENIMVVELAPVHPAFGRVPASEVFGHTPVPGGRRVIKGSDLARLAARYGFDGESFADTCVERRVAPLTREAVAAAINASLNQPGAVVEIVDFSRFPVPSGKLDFPLGTLATPSPLNTGKPVLWRGTLTYDTRSTLSVWARVRIRATQQRIVAAEDLKPGREIVAAQVRLVVVEDFPSKDPGLASVSAAVGQVPRRWIRAGEVLRPNLVTKPPEVKRGDRVQVQVESGSARIIVQALAESNGAAGEPVVVKNLISGNRFRAKVQAKGKVLVSVN
ncbi:MAG TPA: flagellar basal body P-ring formation chaperone FlgA [Bryobacteraceae bacterium]|nr:flagellar basal body P-ring formation chaperone FlgA [Bryobacteraceae bacterium]